MDFIEMIIGILLIAADIILNAGESKRKNETRSRREAAVFDINSRR